MKRLHDPSAGKTTLALVEWVDAAHEDGPVRADEMAGLVTVHSAGLLVREDDESITLATDYSKAKGTWRDVTCIPRSCVKWVRKARV